MSGFNLKKESKQLLIDSAKKSIFTKLPYKAPENIPEELDFKSGCFVTLHKNGNLRGCIGNFREIQIVENVYNMAREAAYGDPRFNPLEKEEFDKIDIEISVLSPMKRITDINEIQVGRHGLYIKKGFFSGVLLPQVATEYNWDKLTFLGHTCLKAGLNQNCWQDSDTEIYTFEAFVFDENEI